MLGKALSWFFLTFGKEFRQGKLVAFQTLMFLALAHFFGVYNPKQLADFLGIPHQKLYAQLKEWSLYYLREMLMRFMVKQAVERLKPVLAKSPATLSRSGITLSVDNSVLDRLGRLLRCTWSWSSGRWKKVVNGQALLGVVLTIGGIVFPWGLWFCATQGRATTAKPSLLIALLARLKKAFAKEGIDIPAFPLTLDSWFVSAWLRKELQSLGFSKIILAGKGNYVFTIGGKKQKASLWRKEIVLPRTQWGIEVAALRVRAINPTFGDIVVLFSKKSTTRNYYLLDFSESPMRGAEIWHSWKQHAAIEAFWKLLKSILKIKAMQLQGDGLYIALLIKVLAYVLALRVKAKRGGQNSPFRKL